MVFTKTSQMNLKSNHCADNVMIWYQTVAKIILLQVLFCRDCAGFLEYRYLYGIWCRTTSWLLISALDNLLLTDFCLSMMGLMSLCQQPCMRATSTRRPWNSLTSREKGLSLTTITRRGIYESSPSSFSSPRVRGASGRRSSARCQTYISHKLIY